MHGLSVKVSKVIANPRSASRQGCRDGNPTLLTPTWEPRGWERELPFPALIPGPNRPYPARPYDSASPTPRRRSEERGARASDTAAAAPPLPRLPADAGTRGLPKLKGTP